MVPAAPARIACLIDAVFPALARQRQIADRDDASVLAVGHGAGQMPPAIAERIKLLGIAEIEMGLLTHPFAQALLQRALRAGIEGTEGQGILAAIMGDHQSARFLAFHRNDGRGKADADRAAAHRPASGKAVVTPSVTLHGSPITLRAATMRPPRPNASSAWRTSSVLGLACGARRRIA